MQYRFFTIPIFEAEEPEAALNAFLSTERILHVDRYLIQDGRNSVWAVCVGYQNGVGRSSKDKRGKTDYRALLSEPEFAVFARMRSLRKELADREGVPAYAIFTNEQLALIVQRRADTLQAMREIEGVGEARLEKYGAAFQELMQNAALPAREAEKRETVAG
jgi:superfamily II DNA helicase RecQ